jgi:flavin-binding protein dodecin
MGGDGGAANPAKIGPFPGAGRTVATYKMIKVAGTSPESFAKAAQGRSMEAAKSAAEPGLVRGQGDAGPHPGRRIAEYQVMVEIGFKLE